jgi:hypothetical protein
MKRYTLLLLALLLLGTTQAAPPQQIDNLAGFSNALRVDLEQLADVVLDETTRPTGWTGNIDIRSPQMISDVWFDMELLANEIYGEGLRPPGWFGLTSSRPEIIARNTRHDLELAADTVFYDETTGLRSRPDTWLGASSRFQCDRAAQNVFRLADRVYNRELELLESTLNYCLTARVEMEDKLAIELGLNTDPALPELTLAVRGDLERLADEMLGLNTRAPNWIGTKDIESPLLGGEISLDMITLADRLLGQDLRPEGWVGFVTNNPYVSWRNLRYDLELLTDATLGLDVRPRGWQRSTELARCAPAVQDLVNIVSTEYEYILPETVEAGNYCQEVAAQANQLAENPPVEDELQVSEADRRFMGESDYAFAYLDVGASQYMGIMPGGVEFRAWYRNFAESDMMFVSGDDFAVFIDRRWTSLPQNIYDRLPTLEGVEPLTFCDANWCNGPGPTPTPTGSGPLALLLLDVTPIATVAGVPGQPGALPSGEKLQVSWNNIRVTYLSDNTAARTAQVALEICAEPAQVNCEPVLSIIDNAAGAPKPVLSQFNGLSVFEFSWGYTSNLVIEGSTLVSPDVWISDPSIR